MMKDVSDILLQPKLYYTESVDSFTEQQSVLAEKIPFGVFSINFILPVHGFNCLRFDPTELFAVELIIYKIVITTMNNEMIINPVAKLYSNGIQRDKQVWEFLNFNPQVFINFDFNVKEIQISGEIKETNKILNNRDADLFQKTKSFSWRIIKPLRLLWKNNLRSHLFFIKYGRTIKQSGLFDVGYYLQNNPDILAAGINPLKHYLLYGGFEGRKPGPAFDSAFYLAHYPDVKASGINPLVHYIKFGRKEDRLTKAFEINEDECLKKADINDLEQTGIEHADLKIAIVCHLFYFNMADEFIRYFKNIPFPFDLYITTTHDNEKSARSLFTAALPEVKTTVLATENKGRDIGPLIALLKTHLMQYDLVCKVHSKKSGHDVNLQGWRKYLLDQLLGNPLIIKRIISEFIHNKQLGLIWPVAHPYFCDLGLEKGWGPPMSWNKNYRAASVYFSELHLEDFGQDFIFPIGSMFWFRPKALGLIVQKNIDINHFEEEEKQIDGTLAHAFERLFGIIPRRAGFETKTVFFSELKT